MRTYVGDRKSNWFSGLILWSEVPLQDPVPHSAVLSYLARFGTKRSSAQLSGTSGKALQACSDLIRRWLRVAIFVMKRSYSFNTEPRLVIARVPADELVAVARVQADL